MGPETGGISNVALSKIIPTRAFCRRTTDGCGGNSPDSHVKACDSLGAPSGAERADQLAAVRRGGRRGCAHSRGTHGIARYQLTHSQFGKSDGRRALRAAEEELRRRREEERKAREGEEWREAYRWLEGSHLFKPTPSPPTLPRPGFRTAVFAPASDVEESFQGRRTDCETPGTPLLQSACRRSSSAKETSSVSKGATQITGALECARFSLAQNVSLHGVLGGQDAPARAREGNPRRRPKGSQARSGAGSSPMTRVETRCSGKAR